MADGHNYHPSPPPDPQSSHLTDHTFSSSSTFVTSPLSHVLQRPGYQRVSSAQEMDTSYRGAAAQDEEGPDRDSVHGLRIQFPDHDEDKLAFGASVHKDDSNASDLLSPSSARGVRFGSKAWGDSPPIDDQHNGRYSPVSQFNSPYAADSENDPLRRERASTMGTLQSPGALLSPTQPLCRSKKSLYQGRMSWISVSILLLSIYSTIFSAIWLGLAASKLSYHKTVMNKGPLPPTTASLLANFFAKTIELSFVTVFVTALGQILGKIASTKGSRGITLADMHMRVWIQQPGTIFTHWETVRYGGLTFLGAITLSSTILSMLYTTASDALVTPHLRYGRLERRPLLSNVTTVFANQSNQVERCKMPIGASEDDPWILGQTCTEIEHSGQAYHNYVQYLESWDAWVKAGGRSTKMKERPMPVGLLYDNTTVTGSWVEESDVPAQSAQYQRIINNVTLAMPLTAVFGAARLERNSIMQPIDFNGLGEYHIQASVPSPTINVLCAEMTEDELAPIVFNEYPQYKGTVFNFTEYAGGENSSIPKLNGESKWSDFNTTKVDDIFQWGEDHNRKRPVFPKIPDPYQTVFNGSNQQIDSTIDSVYVLATANTTAQPPGLPIRQPYMLCSIRSSMSINCSTEYHASKGGGNMTTRCEDPHDPSAYHKNGNVSLAGSFNNQNWTDVANRWAITTSLGAGATGDKAANARLLTQFQPTGRSLNETRASIAEALAVLAGCTLILSGIDSPVVPHWNIGNLTDPASLGLQPFNATVRSQEYFSGGTQTWQGMFYIVLVGTFLLNVFCLLYFLVVHGIIADGLMTDFMEPQNLFALAVNSPPSRALEGTCGGGPERGELVTNWHVDKDERRGHYYIHSHDEPDEGMWRRGPRARGQG
ncbi:uncharacterized protein KY384_001248 [Bacidia gigantensis]|uniref:uncharacterized protein n=1 Tax=Bacidia gigantensis TaxID=2732470 RepID=UPI001D04D590|nr:uncharacterized protein KY384_001248 [Bacidia gigantensis]KAG8534403.1 hypothetical protein KY384_001248 [Bacidia gigantensis]